MLYGCSKLKELKFEGFERVIMATKKRFYWLQERGFLVIGKDNCWPIKAFSDVYSILTIDNITKVYFFYLIFMPNLFEKIHQLLLTFFSRS